MLSLAFFFFVHADAYVNCERPVVMIENMIVRISISEQQTKCDVSRQRHIWANAWENRTDSTEKYARPMWIGSLLGRVRVEYLKAVRQMKER